MTTSLSKVTDEVVMKVNALNTRKDQQNEDTDLFGKEHLMSLIDDDRDDECYLCGCYSQVLDVHHIFGGSVRKTCDKYGLTVHLCRDCHRYVHDQGGASMDYLHTVGQRTYEKKIGTREQFIKEFIRSYL